ncbi:dTDP-glucose 4,6-dehydratase [Micromonospora sp. C95]|uniref:dTDP-glucose 4,6-dehydratase n=1 Tax=Micromonospora sp. C95 TaxID=2824882 RepID=UPI001B359D7D|nr:dTDP-glucose 4,6-dehydratase [Micromonospora sp. C95]MBQ1024153.1 dTDP-glucose 4,6-dehydratase [Micromonospora sp. C95]
MRILVTGGAGFVGSEYVRMLLKAPGSTGPTDPQIEPIAITVLDKLTYSGNLQNLASVRADPRLRFVRGDICDLAVVNEVVPGHDVIVHFAAESHVDRSIAGAAPFVTTNVHGTQNLLDAALRHGTRRFVHVSTDEVYGSIDKGSWTEGWPLAPNSPYSASKAGSDLLALAYHRTHGLDVVVTRCSNNYGPYQFPEKIIPLFVTNLLLGGTVPLYGDGGNIRDWLHVHDHCVGIALVQEKGRAGEVYNIGGGTDFTNKELTGRLLVACDAGWDRVVPVPDRKGHDRRYALNISKIRNELGYDPSIDIERGLAETVQWYRDNRAWWEPLKGAALSTVPA